MGHVLSSLVQFLFSLFNSFEIPAWLLWALEFMTASNRGIDGSLGQKTKADQYLRYRNRKFMKETIKSHCSEWEKEK